MARNVPIKFIRTVRANLNTQIAGSGLLLGEPYLITDDVRLAIGTGVNTILEMVPTGSITTSGLTTNTARFLGRLTASAGAVEELTATQLTAQLDVFTVSVKGLAPPSIEAVGSYLRDDGNWVNPTPVVKCASTANFANTGPTSTVLTASATGVTTIDGQNLALSDRVLLKNQTNAQENGVYKVTTAGAVGVTAVLTRALDFNTWAEVSYSPEVNVQTGTVNADTLWVSTADTGGTLGTTVINFKKILTNTDVAAVAISGSAADVTTGTLPSAQLPTNQISRSIKGTTAGTPGTGAFTPNGASAGFRAWSNVSSGWIGLVRYEDGSAWELTWSYWNGTTLSRATTQVFDSSTGGQLTLTSAATAAFVIDPALDNPHLGSTRTHWMIGNVGINSLSTVGSANATTQGTTALKNIAATSMLTMFPAIQVTSATTANAQAGFPFTAPEAVVSTTAGLGGFEFRARFGIGTLPTGPRLFVGVTDVSFATNVNEPSALTANVATFAKDSTDTNIQLLTNSNAGGGTKIDTGIALAVNGVYEMRVWCDPGNNKIYGLIFRLDTGAIWYGSTTTDVPSSGALMMKHTLGGLSGTTGTAFTLHFGSMTLRPGMATYF